MQWLQMHELLTRNLPSTYFCVCFEPWVTLMVAYKSHILCSVKDCMCACIYTVPLSLMLLCCKCCSHHYCALTVPDHVKHQYEDNCRWIKEAGLNKLVVGSQARILYCDRDGRMALALAFNKAVADGKLQVSQSSNMT